MTPLTQTLIIEMYFKIQKTIIDKHLKATAIQLETYSIEKSTHYLKNMNKFKKQS